MSGPDEGPKWRQTLTMPWEYFPSDGVPDRSTGYSACSVRGSIDGLPRRWMAGHWRIDPDAFRFWRHLSDRSTPIVVPHGQVQAVQARGLGKREWFLVNPGCRVLVCDGPPGRLEVALLHRGELEILGWYFGASESLMENPADGRR